MPKVKITGLPQMKSGGYTVRKSNARKGKTHVVIGPDGTKKYFGDPKMGERGKSKHGKEAFYARHAKNLKNNPYFRAYARATWADGGMVDMYEGGGDVPTPMYNPSVPEVSVFDLTKQAMGGLIYDDGGTTGPGDPPVVLNPSLVGTIIPTTPIGVKGGTPYDAPRTDVNETGVVSWLADEPVIEETRPLAWQSRKFSPEELAEMHKNKKYGKNPIARFFNKAGRKAAAAFDIKDVPTVKLGCPGGRCHEDGGYVYSMGGMIYSNGGPIMAGEGYVQNDDMSGFAEGGRYATSDSPVPQRTSGLMNYLGYGKPRPFAMGGYKMYFDGGPGGPGGPNNPPVTNETQTFGTGLTGQVGSKPGTKIDMSNVLATWQPVEEQKRFFAGVGEKMGDKDLVGMGWKRTVVDGNVYYDRDKAYAPGFMERFKYVPVTNPEDYKSMKATGVRNPYGMQYWGDYNNNPSAVTRSTTPVVTQPTQPTQPVKPKIPTREDQGWTKVIAMDEWARGNQKGLEWMKDYAGGQGSAGYNIYMRNAKDPKAFSQPVSDKESYDFFQQYKRNPNTYEELQQYVQGIRKPYNPPETTVNETGVISRPAKAMGGLIYAQGGNKLPQSILRARLESHMSPEEVDNYLANYAGGGNTGTGILGNMTFNPSPWKYVEGGQLGPYPYSGYKSDLSEFKKGGIHIKPENRGKFTASAKKAGMGVQEYARHVLANKENYSPTLVKRANFARNAAKWKHAYGGYQVPQYYPGGPTERPSPLVRNMMADLDRQQQEEFRQQTGQDMWDYYSNGYANMINYNAPSINNENITPNVSFNPSMEGTSFEPYIDPNTNLPSTINWQDPLFRPTPDSKEEDKKNKKEDKKINPFTLGNKFYYPGQLAQQTLGELAYLAGEGKSYKKAPEYTYTPEQYSARMPLRAIDEAGRAAAMELAARNTGAGNYMANRIALANKLAGAGAKTIEDIDMANMAARNAARQANLTMKRESDLQTLQNEQKALENFYKTIGSVGMKGATTGKDMRAEQIDALKWQYLPEIYKAMALNPDLMKKYKEGLGI